MSVRRLAVRAALVTASASLALGPVAATGAFTAAGPSAAHTDGAKWNGVLADGAKWNVHTDGAKWNGVLADGAKWNVHTDGAKWN